MYEKLFTPVKIGSLTIKNRFAEGATGGNSPRFVGIVTRPKPPDIIRKILLP